MNKKNANDLAERLKIAEKALANLAETMEKREAAVEEDISDILLDLKALKLFFTRNIPSFKERFPEMRRKVK